ncbi:hypothetical protein [Chryseobacterium oryctis]|uniref:Transglutaminase-like domain-containing protein n=1 Tax=Chryseobacterium oryctis TaxID=2952618 RepID=A0ABT3HK23_9FLAO|nr:hypothetical protein [Chryseobacterium oryctis]MCW3160114.1 hypothetical protein [Chryseobacterium oryctis]
MKKRIVFFMLISSLGFSQQKAVKITDLQPKSEDFKFPLVSYPQNNLVENKINTFLQVNELEYVPNSEGNPFKKAATATNSYSNYVYFYGWDKLETPSNILTITMDGEATGAYSESFSIWQNFDLRTGNFINAQDLFSPNSIKKVEDIINQKVRKRVDDFLKDLRAEKNKEDYHEDQISIYENCFTEHTLEYINYYFGKNTLKFVAGRCSNHAMRALDDLGSHVIEIPYKDLEEYWSSYALQLLSDTNKVESTSFQNKLYRGKIDGKYPITVLIKRLYTSDDENSFSAVYWYDRNKKLIEWDGRRLGNKISIIENDYFDEVNNHWIPRAFIEASIENKKIIGTWQDYKTKKYLKIELEEY